MQFKINIHWNPIQAELKSALSTGRVEDALRHCLDLHAMVHFSPPGGEETLLDQVWKGVHQETFIADPGPSARPMAWHIWHITRIEDIVANLLLSDGGQVLDQNWLERLGTEVTETGNAMDVEAATSFSRTLSMDGMEGYRRAVGERTRAVLLDMSLHRLKQKVNPEDLERVREEGGVTEHPDSLGLLRFWGSKNLGGLWQMPLTRHQAMHLSECLVLKTKVMN